MKKSCGNCRWMYKGTNDKFRCSIYPPQWTDGKDDNETWDHPVVENMPPCKCWEETS